MFNYEVRNAFEFNREKQLRSEVMNNRDMFGGMRLTVNESLLSSLFSRNDRI